MPQGDQKNLMGSGFGGAGNTPTPLAELPWAPGTIDPKTLKYAQGGKIHELNKTFKLPGGVTFKDTKQGDYILRIYTNPDKTYSYATMGYYAPTQSGGSKLVEFDIKGRKIGGIGQPAFANLSNDDKSKGGGGQPKYQYGIAVSSDKYYVPGDTLAKQAGLTKRVRSGIEGQMTASAGTAYLPTILGAPIGMPGAAGGSTVLG